MLKHLSRALKIGFPCGLVAFLALHQGGLFALQRGLKVTSATPWSMTPMGPYGVPAVIWLALWAGIYGLVLAFILRLSRGLPDFPVAIVLAVLLTLAAPQIHVPGGLPMFQAGTPGPLWITMLLNGLWAFGTVFLTRPFALRG